MSRLSILTLVASLVSLAAASSIHRAPRAVPENYYDGSAFGSSCYRNDGTFSVAPAASYVSLDMTNEACSNFCGDRGLRYSATSWGTNCACSAQPPQATQGTNTCISKCTGATSERCGGLGVFTVWRNTGVRQTVTHFGAPPLGCYYDEAGSGKPRTLNSGYLAAGNMTQEYCANFCGAKDYRYAGLEYGQECMCGNDPPTVTTGATCGMACSGDATQTCGGSWSMTVLQNTNIAGNPSTPNGNTVLGPNYSSKGCFADNVGTKGRTLTGYAYTDPAMTVEKCAATCSAKKFPISGVEYSTECYCASLMPVVTSTACNMPCGGAKRETCGGPNALNVFVDSTYPLAPTDTCSNLPAGYVPCTEGQKVVGGVCVSA